MAKLIVKHVATAKGIKQSHLQISAAVTPPLLYRYWHNKSNTVDLTELEKIAEALGVSPGELIIPDGKLARFDRNLEKAEKVENHIGPWIALFDEEKSESAKESTEDPAA